MNKETFNQLLILMDASAKLMKCAIKKCKSTMENVQKNANVQKLKLLASTTKDVKKRMEIVNKIIYNKDVIEHDMCLYKECKVIYMKLIDVLIETFQKFLNAGLFKSNMDIVIKHLKEIKKLSKKKSLTSIDVNNIQKNKNLLLMTMMINPANVKPA